MSAAHSCKGQVVLSLSEDLDELEASILRALASRTRLRFVHALATGPCEVHDLAEALGLSQAATSQHLAALRAAGIVEATRDGRSVEYRLSDPQIGAACDLLRGVLVRRLTYLGDLAANAEETGRYARLAAGGGRN
jgi:DNA-binding transcriptional ArsR family regulator